MLVIDKGVCRRCYVLRHTIFLFENSFSVGEIIEVSKVFKTDSKIPIELHPYQMLIVKYVGDHGSITVKDYPLEEWEYEEWIQIHNMIHLKKTGIVVRLTLFFIIFTNFTFFKMFLGTAKTY